MIVRPVAIIAGITLACVGGFGCQARQTPEEVLQLADSLIEAGEPQAALDKLGEADLLGDPRGARLAAEAWIIAGEYDLALEIFANRTDLADEDLVVRADACAMGAIASLDAGNPEAAAARIQPCADQPRLDLRSLRLRLAPAPPEGSEVTSLVDAVRAAEPAPEIDVAAEQLEAGLVAFAEQATDDLAAIEYLRAAFSVGRDPELNDRLTAAYMAAAEARFTSDPQTAATLYEHLTIERVPGLTATAEQRARATQRSQDALYPVFFGNFEDRYSRKFQPADIEAGVYNAESKTFTLPAPVDAAARAAVQEWIYRHIERPQPTPTPDMLAWASVCTDAAVPCTFSFDVLARWAYYSQQVENEYAAANGISYTWPNAE